MRKFLALVLALVMTMSLVTVSAGAATDFTDDAKITNAEAVEVLNAIGVMGGYADGSFRPQATLTRGAGAKLIAYLMLGQTKADALKATYTVFEDVDDTVGLAPYIEWAAANGIVGGYGDGNFGPYNTLTEYAFGKMLLGALNYDAEKQGYTGSGWQTRVYRDAVAKSIFDGTESNVACTRDTAARLALATLESSYVVYGDAQYAANGHYIINGQVVTLGQNATVTVNGPVNTNLFVYQTYGNLQFAGNATDVWGNPGDRWTYKNKVIGFYEDAALLTYTTQVDKCDLLVALGLPVDAAGSVNLTMNYNGAGLGAARTTYGHDQYHNTCDREFIGGQGVLTKVFATTTPGTYTVTEVATYLAKVTAVTKNHNGYNTTFTVYDRELLNYGDDADTNGRDLVSDAAFADSDNTGKTALTNAYAVGDYALVTMANDVIVDHQAVTGVAGTLNTFLSAAQDATEFVGTTNNTKDAFGFVEGYEFKAFNKLTTPYIFFFDTYGNVIGMVDVAATATYAVIDAIWTTTDGLGVQKIGADVVTMDAVTTAAANVAKYGNQLAAAATGINQNKKLNTTQIHSLHTYTVDANGDYTLTDANVTRGTNVVRTAADVDSFQYYIAGQGTKTIELSEKTQILARDFNGQYKAYTGYTNLPVLAATYAEVVMDATLTDEAAIVYLHNVAYHGDKVLGYIANTNPVGAIVHNTVSYYVYNMYVDGALRQVYTTSTLNGGAGLYEVQFNAVDGLLAVNTITKQDNSGNTTVKYVANDKIVYAGNIADTLKISFQNSGTNLPVNGVEIYVVDQGFTTVTAGTYADLVNNANVDLVFSTTGALLEIYVLLGA